jgi:hypothetical protein
MPASAMTVRSSSHYNPRREHACVDPLEIHVPMVRNYSEHLMLERVEGFDLVTRRPTFAPRNCAPPSISRSLSAGPGMRRRH